REVVGAADLDLQGREGCGPPGPLRDDRRRVEPEGEVRRRDVRREAEEIMDGTPRDLAHEVVEGDVEGAFRRAVPADRVRHAVAHRVSRPNRTGSAAGSPVSAAVWSMTRLASASSRISEVFTATATTRDGATRPATVSWRRMNSGSLAIGKDTSGRWAKSCSVR